MILSAGLTPAWQQILQLDQLQLGEVNRARQAVWCASGKVLNVARACWCLGAETLALCPTGGCVGAELKADFRQDNIPALWVNTSSGTRTCTTLIDRSTGQVTELVENAGPISPRELQVFCSTYAEYVPNAAVAVLTGSLPAGVPPTFYAELLDRGDVPAVLDARGPELLAALPRHPLLVKPNRMELEQTLGRALVTDADLREGMRELLARGAQWVLVTQGSAASWLASVESIIRFAPPRVQDVVNPIGCGDCLAAGIAVQLVAGARVPDAVAFGLAAAAENIHDLLPARLSRPAVDRLATEVGREPWPATGVA